MKNTVKLGAKKDGTLTALRIKTVADHGYTDAAANPSKFPAGLFHICTGSYDLKHAFVEVDGVYTNKPPGGIAYRCSFRVTEAVHTIERMADLMAHELGMDPAVTRKRTADSYLAQRRFPDAIGIYRDLLKSKGPNPHLYDLLGSAYEFLIKMFADSAGNRPRRVLAEINANEFLAGGRRLLRATLLTRYNAGTKAQRTRQGKPDHDLQLC